MKIAPAGQIRVQNRINQSKKQTAFGMHVEVSEKAKGVLEPQLFTFFNSCTKKMKKRFFNNQPFNFDNIIKNYMNSIEKTLGSQRGKLILAMGDTSKENPEILFDTCLPTVGILRSRYINNEGKRVAITMKATDLLPDRYFDRKNPMLHAALLTEEKVNMLQEQAGVPVNRMKIKFVKPNMFSEFMVRISA